MKYSQNQIKTLTAASRILEKTLQEKPESYKSPLCVMRYLQTKLIHKEHEVFAVMFLNNRHQMIEYKEMFQGTIDSAAVYPREVAKAALQQNAAAVILAHNHPSGISEPSQADIRLTGKLKEALGLFDIRVLDHIVVGNGCTSFADEGLL